MSSAWVPLSTTRPPSRARMRSAPITLDHRLALRIHRGERLVEDENGRVTEEGARDGDALALAAGETHAALAHHRLIALGEARDELLGVGGARRRLELGGSRFRLAHAQVVLHGALEEIGVLAHHRDETAELIEGEIADVAAADGDAPAVGIVKA